MAVTKYKTFVPNEVLTAADINASLDQVFNNQESLGYPRTTSADFNGQEIVLDADADTSLRETADDVIALKMQGQDVFIFDGDAASANNGFRFTAGTTAAPQPRIDAQGTPTDIGFVLAAKGAAQILLSATNGIDIDGKALVIDADADSSLRETSDDVLALKLQGVDSFIFDGDVASPVNGLTFRSSATASAPVIAASGGDTNIGITLTPKGTGTIQLGTGVVSTTPITNGIPQADSGSTISSAWLRGVPILQTIWSPSAAASVDIVSSLGTYDTYFLDFYLVPATDGVMLNLRTDSSNGASFDSGGSDYAHQTSHVASSQFIQASSATTAILLAGSASAGNIGNATNEGVAGRLIIHNRGSGTRYPILSWVGGYLNTSTSLVAVTGSGVRNSAAAIDAVQFLFSSGNIASGSIRVWGMVHP